MSDLRKAAQALVDRWDTPLWKEAPHTGTFIDALRAALAQSGTDWEAEAADQALTIALMKSEQEAVAWGCFRNGVLLDDLVSDEASVDYWCESDEPEMQRLIKRALYTAPPQRKPLTDEQCVRIFREAFLASSDPLVKDNMTVAFARAIERAHEIGVTHEY